MHDDNPLNKSFMKSLKKRATERRIWALEEGYSAYRLFDCEHTVPLTIDIFNNKYLHIVSYLSDGENDAFDVALYIDLASRALAIDKSRIFYKERNKLKNRQQYEKEGDKNVTLWVTEGELSFKVNLSDYIDTGLFLDHRSSRFSISSLCAGRRVLNLFCYTGSFSVHAAAAEAAFIKSVDLSKTYLEWAKENMTYNHQMGSHIAWVEQDVNLFLDEEVASSNRYDIIILDPPIFSNSRKMDGTLDVKKDHPSLINRCLKLLTKEGFIFFSTPSINLKLREELIDGKVNEITKDTIPYDFRRSKPHRSYTIKRWYQKPSHVLESEVRRLRYKGNHPNYVPGKAVATYRASKGSKAKS